MFLSRPVLALTLLAVYLGLTFGLRSYQHLKATGSTGFNGISGTPGSASWWGGVLFVLGLVVAGAAPVLELTGVVGPMIEPPPLVTVLGAAATLVGVLATYGAQVAMGQSWRIGVRATETTQLVVGGPFEWVRNPIFSCMLLTGVGLVLLLPNLVALLSLACLFVAVELHVRLVEEPYLQRTHGAAYAAYCRRVGRFVPNVGRRRA